MHLSLGDGHTGVGALAGRNGVAVIEHGANYRNAVLVYNAPIADNTRVAVVYRDGVPNLYLNGKFAKSGLKSPRIPHPSRAEGRGFSGHVDSVFVSDKPFGDAEAASDAAGASAEKREISDIEPVPFVSEDGRIRAEFFRNGRIDAELADGSREILDVRGRRAREARRRQEGVHRLCESRRRRARVGERKARRKRVEEPVQARDHEALKARQE